ncbi:MAG: Gfo/Idh/MocA family oxidoreductase [Leptolyngbyaceae bacterium]|nr:Gfo/Idh/MocA family oxidoreductase [Leptolyngbyaceae bacterium]
MHSDVFRFGLVGLGRWGTTYLKSISQMAHARVDRVAGRPHQRGNLHSFPDVGFTEDWREVCSDQSLDGVIICSSPDSHYELVKYAIGNGIPVIVEKPFTLSASHTEELNLLSQRAGVLCMVAYTHLFAPGYRDLKGCVTRSGSLSKIFSEGFSSGPFRENVPVLWDWGSHDVSMCLDLVDAPVVSAELSAVPKPEPHQHSQILMLQMKFSNEVEARCIFGNAAEFKRRDLFVVCGDDYFLYDGLSPGLARQFSSKVSSINYLSFKEYPKPLDCLVTEFVSFVRSGRTHHYSIDLASRVNRVLAGVGSDLEASHQRS